MLNPQHFHRKICKLTVITKMLILKIYQKCNIKSRTNNMGSSPISILINVYAPKRIFCLPFIFNNNSVNFDFISRKHNFSQFFFVGNLLNELSIFLFFFVVLFGSVNKPFHQVFLYLRKFAFFPQVQ